MSILPEDRGGSHHPYLLPGVPLLTAVVSVCFSLQMLLGCAFPGSLSVSPGLASSSLIKSLVPVPLKGAKAFQ